jgi:3-oxoacyl-[acyl-carrier protein] reductase
MDREDYLYHMNLNLNGKTALVCGSSQGIGLASAVELAALGARVMLLARNEQRLKEALAQLPNPSGAQHGYLVADFAVPGEAMHVVGQWVARGETAHILVNNTGGPPAGPAHTADAADFIDAFLNHLINNQQLVKTVIPGMEAAGYGRIINIISTSVKAPLPNLGVSNTIRGAVANWSKTLANELGPKGITVNNVLPGATETARLSAIIGNKAQKTGHATEAIAGEMLAEIPLGRFAQPEEIGAAVAWLASPAAAYVSGINLPVDGGRTPCL